jgi:hypothetical protein
MALADYYRRNVLAASGSILGLNEDTYVNRMSEVQVGLAFSSGVWSSVEGRTLLELLVRLMARVYPRLILHTDVHGPATDRLARLARAINPAIQCTIGSQRASFDIVVGAADARCDRAIFAGSDGWTTRVSTDTPSSVGSSGNPFGAAAGACLAAALLFRSVFEVDVPAKETIHYSLFEALTAPGQQVGSWHEQGLELDGPTALVGCGAVGNAAAFVLGQCSLRGTVAVIDPEDVDLGNLQRYALTVRQDVGRAKVDVVKRALSGSGARIVRMPVPWDQAAALKRFRWSHVIVGLDSARARRDVQASLPCWVANAWTQQDDLGVSVHPRFGEGACLSCLYLPGGPSRSEDEIVAAALGIPELSREVRRLLYKGDAVPIEIARMIAERLHVPIDDVVVQGAHGIRNLYSNGVCGSLLVTTATGETDYVPLPQQSVMAGTLLAATLVLHLSGYRQESTQIHRMNIMRPFAPATSLPAMPDPRGICICADDDYVATYQQKWHFGKRRSSRPEGGSPSGAPNHIPIHEARY